MTGAKLLGMHESVTSPKSKRSQRVVRLTVMPASCRGAMRTTFGPLVLWGNPRPKFRRFPDGIEVPWLCGAMLEGQTSRGSNATHPQSRGHSDRILRIGRLQAVSRGSHPKVDLQRPRCRETRERNRAGHTSLAPSHRKRASQGHAAGVPILPRQGEVAPKATEGEDGHAPRSSAESRNPDVGTRTAEWNGGLIAVLPLRQAAPATSPWRGRIGRIRNPLRSGRRVRACTSPTVIPAKAGIHIPRTTRLLPRRSSLWIPG